MFITRSLHIRYHLKQAKQAFFKQGWASCMTHYSQVLKQQRPLTSAQSQKFNTAKKYYRQQRLQFAPTIAVSGWELSHNAAGRVLTLADLYQHGGYEVAIIGCVISKNKHKPRPIWQPMQLSGIRHAHFDIQDTTDLVPKAYDFVCQHPFDVIHLSKPRLPNIVLGRLYQLIWGAKVIMDVDDEEMGFAKNGQQIKPTIKSWKHIRSDYWLQQGVALANRFDDTTVSNVSLQQRYGGHIIPHVRDASKFVPSLALTEQMRKRYDIPLTAWVVLFFGTPKPHKGLLQTAQALGRLNRSDVIFLIIGDFIDAKFKKELTAVQPVNFRFLPNQPYKDIMRYVAMGDVCVIMQDTTSLISEHQLPAKLIDALAMGLTAITSRTPALQPLIDSGAVKVSNEDTLDSVLSTIFNQPKTSNSFGRTYFLSHLSTQALAPLLPHLVATSKNSHCPIQPKTVYHLATLTATDLCHL